MHLSKGYLPSSLTIPAIFLILSGYIMAFLYKFFDVELLAFDVAFPWLFSFSGLIVLGRTKETFDDERINQIRNFSFRFLSELFIGGFATISIIGLFGGSWDSANILPGLILISLLGHLYYLKIATLFDGIDESTGKLKIKYHLLFLPYFTLVGILNYILFI